MENNAVYSLLVLSALHDGMEECTQKKISQKWRIPKGMKIERMKELNEDTALFVKLFSKAGGRNE